MTLLLTVNTYIRHRFFLHIDSCTRRSIEQYVGFFGMVDQCYCDRLMCEEFVAENSGDFSPPFLQEL